MAFEILFLSSENVKLLEQIAPDVFDHAIDAGQLQAFLQDPRHVMVIAVDGNTVVGMASAVEYFHPDKKPEMWINEVGVASTHRRQGIAQGLVRSLLKEATDRGCVSSWVLTEEENDAALACYSSVRNIEKQQACLLYEWDLNLRS